MSVDETLMCSFQVWYICALKQLYSVGCMDHVSVLVDVLVVSAKQYSWATERTAQEAGICEQLELQANCSPENWNLTISKLLHIKLFILFKCSFQNLKFNWVIFVFLSYLVIGVHNYAT